MSIITLPRTLKGFDIYFNDQNYAGVCEKFTLPKSNPKLEELNAGGLSRPLKIAVGWEADWDVTFETKGLEMSLLLNHSCSPNDSEIMLLGSLGVGDSCKEEPLKLYFWGQIAEADAGDKAINEAGSTSVTFAVAKAQYFLNDTEIYFEDPMNMVRRIYGVDKLAKRRENLGRQ